MKHTLKYIYALLGLILLHSGTISGESKVQYLFAHGLGATERQASYYQKKDIILAPYHTFSFPDAKNGILDYTQTSLGQDNEVLSLKQAYDQVCSSTKSKKPNIVLSGMSRGASTIINFMGEHNPSQIKALVLESPFDSIDTVLYQKLHTYWISWLPFGFELAQWITETIYGQYKRDGIRPVEHIKKIKNKDIPILFICSKEDILIPWKSTYSLYETCKNAGFTRVHVVVIDHGAHGYLLKGQCRNEYQQAVHAFYKKYNLPHNAQLAKQGSSWLV